MAKSDKRELIIQAALDLIAEHGFHGTSMAMIADRAKVGAGTIYRYFASKDILIMDLFKEVEKALYDSLRSKSTAEQSIHERFIEHGSILLRYLIDNPIIFKYLEQFFNSPYGVAHRREKLMDDGGKGNQFVDLFRDGIAQGQIKELPIVVLFAHYFGPIMVMARDHILGFYTLDDNAITQSLENCWDALKHKGA